MLSNPEQGERIKKLRTMRVLIAPDPINKGLPYMLAYSFGELLGSVVKVLHE